MPKFEQKRVRLVCRVLADACVLRAPNFSLTYGFIIY